MFGLVRICEHPRTAADATALAEYMRPVRLDEHKSTLAQAVNNPRRLGTSTDHWTEEHSDAQ